MEKMDDKNKSTEKIIGEISRETIEQIQLIRG